MEMERCALINSENVHKNMSSVHKPHGNTFIE